MLFWFYSCAECSDLELIFDIIKLCLGCILNMNFNMNFIMNFSDSHSSYYA